MMGNIINEILKPTSIEDGEELLTIALEMAVQAVIQNSMFHLEDHNGVECARGQVNKFTHLFERYAKEGISKLCVESNLEDPFEDNDSNPNAALVKELKEMCDENER